MQKASEKNGSTLRKQRISDESERLSASKTFSKISEKSPGVEKPKKVLKKQDVELNVARTDTFTKFKENKTHAMSKKAKDIKTKQIDKKLPISKKPQSTTTGKTVNTQKRETSVKSNSSTRKSSVNENSVSNKIVKKSVLKKPNAENIGGKRKSTPTNKSIEIPYDGSDKKSKNQLNDSKEIETNLDKDKQKFEKEDYYSDFPKIVSQDSTIDTMQQQSQQSKAFYEREESLQYFEIGADNQVNNVNPEDEIVSESVEWKCLSEVQEHMSGTIDESIDNQEHKTPKTIMKKPNSRKTQLKKKKKSFEDKSDTNSSNNSESSSARSPDKLKNDGFKMPLTVQKRNRINFLLSEKWRVKLPVTHKFIN